MPSLRSELIRLAHANPELRPHLLPLLKQGAGYRPPEWDRKPQMAPAPWERGTPSSGPKMGKFDNERMAQRYAREQGLFYGWSVLGGGGWYAGTKAQLKKIGVPDIQRG